jgi:hypothetical protein
VKEKKQDEEIEVEKEAGFGNVQMAMRKGHLES